VFPQAADASHAPWRHLSVFTQTGRPISKYPGRLRPSKPSTLLELQRPYSIYGHKSPSLHFPFREVSRNRCLDSGKSRPQGLATLSAVLAFLRPWKSFSTSNAHGLRPSELFSLFVIRLTFRVTFSALALSHETRVGLVPALQRLPPTKRAVPSYCSRGINPGRGPCSPGLSGLLGFLRPRPMP
jgi:hypothetical protein